MPTYTYTTKCRRCGEMNEFDVTSIHFAVDEPRNSIRAWMNTPELYYCPHCPFETETVQDVVSYRIKE